MNTKTSTQVRFEILRTLNTITKEKGAGAHNIYPPQIDNSTYSDLGIHLQVLADKGFLRYHARALKRTYMVELLPAGIAFVRDFTDAFLRKDDASVKDYAAKLK